MIELDDLMRECLIEANSEYPDYDYVDTVVQAYKVYSNLVGPLDFDGEVEGEEFFKSAVGFLVDCVLWDLVEKGVVEIDGIEDGELWFKATAEF